MGKEKKIGEILINRLTLEELSALCDSYDDGSLDDIFDTVLIPMDWRKHPEKYCKPDNNIAEGKTDG